MKVFKFGGASVRDAAAVRNVGNIVKANLGDPLLIIVSAMGKTTNKLEEIIEARNAGKEWSQLLDQLKADHMAVVDELLGNGHPVKRDLEFVLSELSKYLEEWKSGSLLEKYSQVVAQGEMISTKIIAAYLNDKVAKCNWVDVRNVLKTDDNFIDAHVNWEETGQNVQKHVRPQMSENIVVTQGFIGANSSGQTTTLGREGSDFSGAVFASCLDADTLTIWKDVPGVLTADPKLMDDANIISTLSYKEAAEMTFYGAKVIHPKTIRPLANKGIELRVRPFNQHRENGTSIADVEHQSYPPIFIQKSNQTLISFKVEDLSFIDEHKMGIIFHALSELNMKVNLMENSATSFSICVDTKFNKVEQLIEVLSSDFRIAYNSRLTMFTIKNYDENSLKQIDRSREVLLEQRSRNAIHLLYAN